MRALCSLLALFALSHRSITIVKAGPIAEYLSEVGLGHHGTNFEQALSSSEWKGHDLDALQSIETFELGQVCSEADMSTKDAIKLSRALRSRAAGLKSSRPEFGSTLDGAGKPKPRAPQAVAPNVHRQQLLHQRTVPLAPSLPRIHVDDIDVNPEFETYRRRERPFILVGATSSWEAIEKWKTLSYLGDIMPNEVTDFYPHNMLTMDRQNPYLTRLGRAIQQLLSPKDFSKFKYDPTAMEGRYMHLQLTPPTWKILEDNNDIIEDRHWHLKGDEWMEECMPDSDLQSEYHLKTHWKIILAGSRGAGMFNHSDTLMTSSWHATVLGTKWWYVCKAGECFESYVEIGEILYYGAGWSHETQNLETPTVTITGTVVHEWNYNTVAPKLHAECASSALNFLFSAKLCDALDTCYGLWHKQCVPLMSEMRVQMLSRGLNNECGNRYTGKAKPANLWPAWRSVSTQENIDKKEKIRPADNNYDGRNYITE